MHLFSLVVAIVVLAASAFSASVHHHSIQTFNGETTGRHVVILNAGASRDGVLSRSKLSTTDITHHWDNIRGFAGIFNEATLNQLLVDPDVKYIGEDGILHTTGIQTNAPWGLSRLSSPARLLDQDASHLNFTYNIPDDKDGNGVDIYIIDSGVRTTHVAFGGRARWGATFGEGYPDEDDYGHGTHCAGIAAGTQYGVAKNANIVAVKVLNGFGSGTLADIISGMSWVQNQTTTSGRPSIASMSLGGPTSNILDDAVAALTNAGVHVTVSAGNFNGDASASSPARAPSAVTVGASTIADARANFSNSGRAIDIWAPGFDVISAYADSDTATKSLSGTSMAAPHVAGLIAYLIARDGNTRPIAMATKIQDLALKNVLTGIPADTVNYLAHNQ